MKPGYPLSPLLILHNPGTSSQSFVIEQINKHINKRKEEIKLLIFADNMIVYVENANDSTKSKNKGKRENSPRTIEFNKATGCKINISKTNYILLY